MIDPAEATVGKVFEQSALVRTVERGGRVVTRAAANSRLIAQGRSWYLDAAARWGHLLVAAALTHILLMLVIAKPVSWPWLILPAIVTVLGLVVMFVSPSGPKEQ